jgi:3-deoxy-manno-octulosonate cytidylyltransferase (CMP-KDO synthetase)
VVIATDHQEIADAVAALGFKVCTTRRRIRPAPTASRGRGALASARRDRGERAGRRAAHRPELIRKVAAELALRPKASIATAAHPIDSRRGVLRPNVVKVVDRHRRATRSTSRARRSPSRATPSRARASAAPELPAFRHIGIYAYRVSFLREYAALAHRAERFEALEQLRALGHGHRIAVRFWDGPMEAGVDTAADLERVRRVLAK